MVSVKVTHEEMITNEVKLIRFEKPDDFSYQAGQHCLFTIEGVDLKRVYSFTSIPSMNYLEFMVKAYHEHNGFSVEMHKLKVGDKVEIGNPFFTGEYSSTGVFLISGIGITPFVSILRQIEEDGNKEKNVLIWSNNRVKDIFMKEWFLSVANCVFTVTGEDSSYSKERINASLIKENVKDLDCKFYSCGSAVFVNAMKNILMEMNVEEKNIIGF